jgi:hypothetical protein
VGTTYQDGRRSQMKTDIKQNMPRNKAYSTVLISGVELEDDALTYTYRHPLLYVS